MKTFGQILSEACDRQGVSQYRLAKLMRVQQSRVPQILRAKNLTERTFKACARALGLELRVQLVRTMESVAGRSRVPGRGRGSRRGRS